jgi:hypothetical protein
MPPQTRTHTRTHTRTQTRTRQYTCNCTYEHTCVHTCVHTYKRTYAHKHAYVHTHIRTYMRTCVHAYHVYMCTHTCVHIHIITYSNNSLAPMQVTLTVAVALLNVQIHATSTHATRSHATSTHAHTPPRARTHAHTAMDLLFGSIPLQAGLSKVPISSPCSAAVVLKDLNCRIRSQHQQLVLRPNPSKTTVNWFGV